jgi:thymidylate synthase
MKQYLDLMQEVLRNGVARIDRTGTGTTEIFDAKLVFDMADGFPLMTTKFVSFKSVLTELKFFVLGLTNNNWLLERGCTIWNEWAKPDGELGPIYGYQWRHWRNVKVNDYVNVPDVGCGVQQGTFVQTQFDQLADLLHKLKHNPYDRRLLVSAWNPGEISEMALPPCHYAFSCYVTNDGRLNLKWHQRSCDLFLGIPYNIASYAILLHVLAFLAGLKPGLLISDLDCVHIYNNHNMQVATQLAREPYALPEFRITKLDSLDDIDNIQYELIGYQYHPSIKADVSV